MSGVCDDQPEEEELPFCPEPEPPDEYNTNLKNATYEQECKRALNAGLAGNPEELCEDKLKDRCAAGFSGAKSGPNYFYVSSKDDAGDEADLPFVYPPHVGSVRSLKNRNYSPGRSRARTRNNCDCADPRESKNRGQKDSSLESAIRRAAHEAVAYFEKQSSSRSENRSDPYAYHRDQRSSSRSAPRCVERQRCRCQQDESAQARKEMELRKKCCEEARRRKQHKCAGESREQSIEVFKRRIKELCMKVQNDCPDSYDSFVQPPLILTETQEDTEDQEQAEAEKLLLTAFRTYWKDKKKRGKCAQKKQMELKKKVNQITRVIAAAIDEMLGDT